MKLIHASCSLLLCIGHAAAQTLTSSEDLIVPGDNAAILSGPYIDPGPSGTGNVWDHSGFEPSSAGNLSYVSPAGTSYQSAFPTATAAISGAFGQWVYYRGSALMWEQIGWQSPFGSVNCPTGITVIEFPLSYGTTFNDEYSCSGLLGEETYARIGTITGEADGTGDLVLPQGTVSNVLRMHWQQDQEDTGEVEQTYILDAHYFFKPGVRFPIVATFDQSGDIVQQYTTILDEENVGFDDLFRNELGMDLQPNPADEGGVNVVWSVADHTGMTIELINTAGAVVQTRRYGRLSPGIQQDRLDLSGIAPGIYTVRVRDDNGSRGTKRLVVH